jgi:hypothetical protein
MFYSRPRSNFISFLLGLSTTLPEMESLQQNNSCPGKKGIIVTVEYTGTLINTFQVLQLKI